MPPSGIRWAWLQWMDKPTVWKMDFSRRFLSAPGTCRSAIEHLLLYVSMKERLLPACQRLYCHCGIRFPLSTCAGLATHRVGCEDDCIGSSTRGRTAVVAGTRSCVYRSPRAGSGGHLCPGQVWTPLRLYCRRPIGLRRPPTRVSVISVIASQDCRYANCVDRPKADEELALRLGRS